ncbi:hypothetical protein OXX59_000412 [Metschnikowia pulcherrima]
MTILSLDPSALSLFYPRASVDYPQKLRLIAQVVDNDPFSTLLAVKRVPNLASLHTEIDLDNVGPEPAIETAQVDLSLIESAAARLDISAGSIVSIIGLYNGSFITAVECLTLESQALLGSSIDTLAAMATLDDL